MFTILVVFLIILGAIMLWFTIPYSPIKNEFQKDITNQISENHLQTKDEVFTEEDFSHLPNPIKQYIRKSGYIGKSKMSYMKIVFNAANFKQSKNIPDLLIDYTQYNFVYNPARFALIESNIYSIPFEGYDSYQNNKGSMKGIIAKTFQLFNQTGVNMDKSALVTFLAESLFVPTSILQQYITFEEVSIYEVKATISYNNITASGIFTFNEQYEMISFTTNDRAITNDDGSMEYIPWSAICSEYKFNENGIKHPGKFQAFWNYPNENLKYFDGKISEISYK